MHIISSSMDVFLWVGMLWRGSRWLVVHASLQASDLCGGLWKALISSCLGGLEAQPPMMTITGGVEHP